MATKYTKQFSSFCYQSNADVSEIFSPLMKLAKMLLLHESTQRWCGCGRAGSSGSQRLWKCRVVGPFWKQFVLI